MSFDVPHAVSAWLAQVGHHGLADSTHRAYAADRRFFRAWHAARFDAVAVLPIPEAVLLTFIADCLSTLPPAIDAILQAGGHKAGAGPLTLTTVKRRLIGIHTWHLEAGVASACRSHPVRQLLRRAQRTRRPTTPARRQPITLPILTQLLATCDASVRGRRDCALLLIGWCCGGRRRSELAALDITDVIDNGTRLRIRWSKTDQTGEGLVVPIPAPARQALLAWLKHHPGDGALFRQLRRGGGLGERLDGGGINRIIKRRAEAAGLNACDISAHGLRSGFVTTCEQHGIPLPVVMSLTGHRSADVAVGYLRSTTQQYPLHTLLDTLTRPPPID